MYYYKNNDGGMVEFDAPWAPNQPNYEYGQGDYDDEQEIAPTFCYVVDANGDWAVAERCGYKKSVACEELGFMEGFKRKSYNANALLGYDKI